MKLRKDRPVPTKMIKGCITWCLIVYYMVINGYMVMVGAKASCYPSIFVFGDSLSDTGNGPLTGNPLFLRSTESPYGETFPGRPFNRFSDGRLIVDFLAQSLGLAFLNPYLDSSRDFRHGLSYAVVGATALNESILLKRFIISVTSKSLEVQLQWHLDYKSSLASGKPDFENGLYVIGIGGNDYNGAFFSLHTIEYVTRELIPIVIEKIGYVTEVLYRSGARNFLFLSITPLGCAPSYLGTFLLGAKDEEGCLEEYNVVAYNHGVQLLREIQSLRATYQDAQFLFADYYNAFTYILQNKESFGFSDTLDACCGAGRVFPYNYNSLAICNDKSEFICSNPNAYLNWDGFHFTDRFNLDITNQFINGSFLDPLFGLRSCAHPII